MKNKLIGIIIFVLLFTSIVPNFIYATDLDYDINFQNFEDIRQSYTEGSFDSLSENGKATLTSKNGAKTKNVKGTFSLGAAAAGAVVGIFYTPLIVISAIMTLVTRDDVIDFSTKSKVNWYTIEDTVYNKIDLFDANYFIKDGNDATFNGKIKNSVAVFYYITKVIAVVMGLLMLIYIGIKMAISTIASDIARYKDMLKDWLVSMVLIFAMPYIIGFINMLASGLVEVFASIAPKSFEQSLILQVFNLVDQTSGWSYVAVALMYFVLTIYQIKFFFMYLYRMLAMGFLIVISPLVTITYSANKTPISGRGDSKMFNNWMREYAVNAFIQPLHAGLYMVFIVSAHEIFTVAPLLAVLFFIGLSRAEKIVKNMFGMRKMSSINSMSEYFPMKRKK